MEEIPYGYCHCGCGRKTNIASKTRNSKEWRKGEPLKWINAGHKRRVEMQKRRQKEKKEFETDINRPYCECGCGKLVNKVRQTDTRKGIKKGQYYKYLENHCPRDTSKRIDRISDATGCSIDKRDGRILIYDKDHPKVKPGRMIPEAHLIAERALGKYLPKGAGVFHFDGDPSSTKNLVVCENRSYISLLIQRKKAYQACGNANYRACAYCGEYSDPKDMLRHTYKSFRHRGCSYRNTR